MNQKSITLKENKTACSKPSLVITKLPIRNNCTFYSGNEPKNNLFGSEKRDEILSNSELYPQKYKILKILEKYNPALLNKFLSCGRTYVSFNHGGIETRESITYECSDCGNKGTVKQRCHLPICPDCIQDRIQRLLSKYWREVEQFVNPKLFTLTVKNVKYMTPDSVRFIIRSFHKLRRLKVFRKVTGGVYGVDITNKGNGWNIHIHAVMDSPYIPQKKLKANWKRITKTSFVVDIRKVKSGISGLYEVLEYIGNIKQGKLNLPKIKKDRDLITYALITSGVRMVGSFGKLYGLKFTYKTQCSECGSENLKYKLVRVMLEVKNIERYKLPPPYSDFLVSGDVIEKFRQIKLAINNSPRIELYDDGHKKKHTKIERKLPNSCHSNYLMSTSPKFTSLEVYGLIKSGLVETDRNGYIWFNDSDDKKKDVVKWVK